MPFCDSYSVLLANRVLATPVWVIFQSNRAALRWVVVEVAYPKWISLGYRVPVGNLDLRIVENPYLYSAFSRVFPEPENKRCANVLNPQAWLNRLVAIEAEKTRSC